MSPSLAFLLLLLDFEVEGRKDWAKHAEKFSVTRNSEKDKKVLKFKKNVSLFAF